MVAFVQNYLAYILAAITALWAILQLNTHIMREKAAKHPDATRFHMDRAGMLSLVNPVARAQPVTAGAGPIGPRMLGTEPHAGGLMIEIRRAAGIPTVPDLVRLYSPSRNVGRTRGDDGLCRHTTNNAQANGWAYWDTAPSDHSQWINKWMCPFCARGAATEPGGSGRPTRAGNYCTAAKSGSFGIGSVPINRARSLIICTHPQNYAPARLREAAQGIPSD